MPERDTSRFRQGGTTRDPHLGARLCSSVMVGVEPAGLPELRVPGSYPSEPFTQVTPPALERRREGAVATHTLRFCPSVRFSGLAFVNLLLPRAAGPPALVTGLLLVPH